MGPSRRRRRPAGLAGVAEALAAEIINLDDRRGLLGPLPVLQRLREELELARRRREAEARAPVHLDADRLPEEKSRGMTIDLGFAFVELSREIEKFAGCSISEIHNLYGTNAYRRYERRALEEAIQIYPEVVIATPGGLVSDPATFNEVLTHCFTVWLQAKPEDHMGRVAAQGDMRPMAASKEAMEDLKRILEGRSAFYSKADLAFDTSAQPLEDAFQALRLQVRQALRLPI